MKLYSFSSPEKQFLWFLIFYNNIALVLILVSCCGSSILFLLRADIVPLLSLLSAQELRTETINWSGWRESGKDPLQNSPRAVLWKVLLTVRLIIIRNKAQREDLSAAQLGWSYQQLSKLLPRLYWKHIASSKGWCFLLDKGVGNLTFLIHWDSWRKGFIHHPAMVKWTWRLH